MGKPKTVYFVLLSGITVRNLLNSGFIADLHRTTQCDITVITSKELFDNEEAFPSLKFEFLTGRRNSVFVRAIYACIRRRGLHVYQTDSSNILINSPLNNSLKLTLSKCLIYPFPKSKKIFRVLHWLLLLAARKFNKTEQKFVFQSNDTVITTSPNTIVDLPVMIAALARNSTTISLIKSFDNTTSKGFFPVPTDFYFCWNEMMAREMDQIFGVKKFRCESVGVPQFDKYFTAVPNSNYLQDTLGIHNGNPTILYATNQAELSPDDVDIVKHISGAFPNLNFLIRVHFMDDVSRWQSESFDRNVFFQFPGASISLDSDLRLTDPKFLDDLSATILSCELVLNTCSTITLDAMCCGVDVGLLSIDLKGRPFAKSVERYYHLAHYKQILDLELFPVIGSIDELTSFLSKFSVDNSERQLLIKDASKTLLSRHKTSLDLFSQALLRIHG